MSPTIDEAFDQWEKDERHLTRLLDAAEAYFASADNLSRVGMTREEFEAAAQLTSHCRDRLRTTFEAVRLERTTDGIPVA